MASEREILEILEELGVLSKALPAPRAPMTPGPTGKGRLFISEYEVKARLTDGQGPLILPKGAILSPLAQEWLDLRGIDITWE